MLPLMKRLVSLSGIVVFGLLVGLLIASCTSDAPTATPSAGGAVVTPPPTPLSEREAERRVDEIIGAMWRSSGVSVRNHSTGSS